MSDEEILATMELVTSDTLRVAPERLFDLMDAKVKTGKPAGYRTFTEFVGPLVLSSFPVSAYKGPHWRMMFRRLIETAPASLQLGILITPPCGGIDQSAHIHISSEQTITVLQGYAGEAYFN